MFAMSPATSPHSLPIGARLEVGGEAIAVRIKNISTRGASILTSRPIWATTDVVLILDTASAKQISLPAITVYSFESEPGSFETGIRLRSLREESSRFVIELMLLLAREPDS